MKLNPCKICGGRAKLAYRKPYSWIYCADCGARTVMCPDSYEERDGKWQAQERWHIGQVERGNR